MMRRFIPLVILVATLGLFWASPAQTQFAATLVQENGAALTALQLIDNLVKVEDDVAGSAWSGVGMLAVRQDSQSALAADGDFIPMTIDNVGGLRVSIVSGAGSGGTAIADDADFVDGTTSGTPIGGVAESASPTTVTEGDFGWAAITLNRALKVTLFDTSGNAVLPATDATYDSAGSTTGPQLMGLFDDATTDSVDEGDAGSLRISANRNLYTVLRDAAGNERGANVDSQNRLQVTGAYVLAEDDPSTNGGAGIAAYARRADTPASSTATDGDLAFLGTDAFGRLYTNPASPQGGATPITMKSDASDNDDETAICTANCTVYSITAFNHAATSAFLRCEADTAANTTPGSESPGAGEPDFEIPGNTAGSGFTVSFPMGISYATALTCWLATGEASTNTTDPGQDDVTVLISRVQ